MVARPNTLNAIMTPFRLFAIFALCLSALFGRAAGAADRATTREFAACLDTDDLPICLLQLTERDAWTPLRYQEEFLLAPGIIAAIEAGRPVSSASSQGDQHEISIFRALELERVITLRAVLDADRRGVSPEDALAPVRDVGVNRPARDFLAGQIHIESGAEVRASLYASIVGRATHPQSYQGIVPPTDGLVRAALEGWESELSRHGVDAFDDGTATHRRLAAGYAALGDVDGVRRALELSGDFEEDLSLAVETRLLLEDFDAAAQLLIGAHDDHRTRRKAWNTTAARFMRAAYAADRANDLAALLPVILSDPEAVRALRPEVFRLALQASPAEETRRLADRLDERARRRLSWRSAQDAQLAFEAWSALDETDRAESLLDLWAQRAVAERQTGCGRNPYGIPGAHCATPAWEYMLARLDRVEEAFARPGITLYRALELELSQGRGLANFDRLSAYARQPSDTETALSTCADWAEHNDRRDLDLAETCIDRLFTFTADREPTPREIELYHLDEDAIPDEIGGDRIRLSYGPHKAATSAIKLGSVAVQEGDVELASRMLDQALHVWRTAPNSEQLFEQFFIRRIAIAQLRREGRL